MRGTKTIRTGEYMKRSIRFKHYITFFKHMRDNPDVSIKQLCNELQMGRNVVIRVFKQANKENMIIKTRIPETSIELFNLTDKGIEWIRDRDEIEV